MRGGVPTGEGLRLTVYRVDEAGQHHGVPQLAVGVAAPPRTPEPPCRCRQCAPAGEVSR